MINTDHDQIRARILAAVDTSDIGGKRETIEQLRESEWSQEFERLMRNRMFMGRFRYGLMARTVDTDYDRIGSAIKRLRNYQRTGNMENLVDAANLCVLEFEHGTHPSRHFEAADDGEHVSKI